MKQLILLRHAKSSWDHPGLDDHARPLAPRGRRAAPAMARWLADHDLLPDRVLCSDAVRTHQTWQRVEEAWADRVPRPAVERRSELYLASARGILELIRAEPDSVDTMMVIGHNPGMHDLACALARPDETPDFRRLLTKFPTAAVAVLHFDVAGWAEVGPGRGRLAAFVRPKDVATDEGRALE